MTNDPSTATDRLPLVDALHFYEAVLGAIGQAVIASDFKGVITYWNDAAARLYGWTSDEVSGRSVMEIIVPSLSQKTAGEIMEALHAGRMWEGDFPVRRKDGSTFIAHVTDAPIFDAKGQPSGVVGISYDVDAIRDEEHSLRESEERFRRLFQQSPIPTMCWKRIGETFVLTDTNSALDAYAGTPMRTLIGQRA